MTLDLQKKLDDILALPAETEWVEFKHNNKKPEEIGEYLSALANGAALHGKSAGYIVWGVEDGTRRILGTTFQPRQSKVGNEELENWLHRLLTPRINFTIHEFDRDGLPVVLWEVQAANSTPVRFQSDAFIRVGSYKKKLKDFPEKERRLWQLLSGMQHDWSAQIVEAARLNDLDSAALDFARTQYQVKHPQRAIEMDSWDDVTFLNKAKACIGGKVTHAALVLLGKEESAHLLSPAVAQLTWILRNETKVEQDYEHFGLPLILSSDRILKKVRNLTIRHLPSGTLFPQEVSQYDPWVMRETLHNCIAHQDYTLCGRISLVETPDSLLFTNMGTFIPGTVEDMIRSDSPPAVYRNKFLADAMVNLNMIDTIGSGIKKMFMAQRQRNFPMPDFDLSKANQVSVQLTGRILDEKYTQLLMARSELELMDVIALDKVQKQQILGDAEFKRLKEQYLIEGRRPNLFVSAKVAATTGDKAAYIKNRAFDKSHYQEMVTAYLQKFGEATRKELDQLLMDKLSDTLDDKQKRHFVTNLLQELRRKRVVRPDGVTRGAKWRLYKADSREEI
ncbi:MAG: putative DNA binding domain-containing protein [Gallionella sp.]|nr:putative DNA binding domain-containing protein [Gallionella sp.]